MKKANITTVLFASMAFLAIPALYSCGGKTCDKKECQRILFGDTLKAEDRDLNFRTSHPDKAKTFSVYVESSKSMDGYLTGLDFRSTLNSLIGSVCTDVVENDACVSYNYIDSSIHSWEGTSAKQFTQSLSAVNFQKVAAKDNSDRNNSDIVEAISKVISNTHKGDISMFVSDCVFSPQAATDLEKALETQRTNIRSTLKKKNEGNKSFGLLLYRFTADFNGIYYDKTNRHIPYTGKRPFFVWFFGDESILSSVYKSLDYAQIGQTGQPVIGIPGYDYVPYRSMDKTHPYHLDDAITKHDSTYSFSFLANLSRLPLSNDYISNPKHYNCHDNRHNSGHYKIAEITTTEEDPDYTHKFTIKIDGRAKNQRISSRTIEIDLITPTFPEWVSAYKDTLGICDGNWENKTFGIKSLADGISDFYATDKYLSFRFKIN